MGRHPRPSKAPMPHHVRPMLATLVDEPFDRAGWYFEPKWDGYRAIAEVAGKQVRLYSRNQLPFEERYRPVVESLRRLGHRAVLDGEVVIVDAAGKSDFHLLQTYQKTGQGRLLYYVFDLLYVDGEDLRSLPLSERKTRLAKMLPELPAVRFSEHVEDRGKAFFKAAVAHQLEGMIAKDAASPYREGMRTHEWLKVKAQKRQEVVIGGFTEPRGSRPDLGALVLGVYNKNRLVYVGHTAGRLDFRTLAELRRRLDRLEQTRCPFDTVPKTNAPAHWVKPKLVCEVTFTEWTPDGRMRHPIFIGLREDKPAGEVRREKEQRT